MEVLIFYPYEHPKREADFESFASSIHNSVVDIFIKHFIIGLLFAIISLQTVPAKAESLEQLQALAGQGNVSAQYNLGAKYELGEGVKQDNAEAVKWYVAAANNGLAGAQHDVGVIYYNGLLGVEKNDEEAVKWYCLAADQGYMQAQSDLGNMYMNGRGVVRSYEEALKWFSLAAKQDYYLAQFNMGVMYEHGYGVLQNMDTAAMWYQKSARQGYSRGQDALEILGYRNDIKQNLGLKLTGEWRISVDNANRKVRITGGLIENESVAGPSENMALRLYATRNKYSTGDITGYILSYINFKPLRTKGCYTGIDFNVDFYSQPPAGNYYMTLCLMDYRGVYYIRDYINFDTMIAFTKSDNTLKPIGNALIKIGSSISAINNQGGGLNGGNYDGNTQTSSSASNGLSDVNRKAEIQRLKYMISDLDRKISTQERSLSFHKDMEYDSSGIYRHSLTNTALQHSDKKLLESYKNEKTVLENKVRMLESGN